MLFFILVYRQNEFSSNISLHFKLGAKRRKKKHNVRAADPTHSKQFLLIVCLYLPSFSRSFQCTETGAHGTCGVSALSSVDQASANACASVTIHRPSLEEKTALVQTDRPCLAVCLIAQ